MSDTEGRTTTRKPLNRVKCKYCNKQVTLKSDGTMRHHLMRKVWGRQFSDMCEGTSQAPAALAGEGAADEPARCPLCDERFELDGHALDCNRYGE